MKEGMQPTGQQPAGATLAAYINGFVLSVVLTMGAYLLVTHHGLSNRLTIAAITTLAMAQFLAQLYFFLHLGRETRPRWKLLVFGGMIVVVVILVAGSLWIMSNLNYHMSTQQINNYLDSQDGL